MGTLSDPIVNGGVPRSLDDPFVVDSVKSTWVSYTVELSVVAPLLSSQSIQVDLAVSSPGGDFVVLDSALLSSSQGGGLSLLSLGTTIRQKLSTFVPPNYTVKLVTTGSGAASIIAAQEAIF